MTGYTLDDLPSKAGNTKRESRRIDFKDSLDIESVGDWCELIKDFVAMANSGGGLMLFGVTDKGSLSGFDSAVLLEYDTAKVVDKLARYTGRQFADFEITEVERDGATLPAFLIRDAGVPMVFTKAGTYLAKDGREKIAFHSGTLYFRHGAKSEPATPEDLDRIVERQVELHRKAWLSGIRKVVKAPPGHTVAVFHPQQAANLVISGPVTGRVVAHKKAPGFFPVKADEKWPHRGIDIVRQVNVVLEGRANINAYDITAIRSVFKLDDHPELAYRPFEKAASQYSQQFIDWLCKNFENNPAFFSDTRKQFKAKRDIKRA